MTSNSEEHLRVLSDGADADERCYTIELIGPGSVETKASRVLGSDGAPHKSILQSGLHSHTDRFCTLR